MVFYTLDVFTDRPFAGNQLAVIPEAAGIPETRLLEIAREFNLSETVFVYPPEDGAHAARIRIFTPARELPFAGHPTIGTAVLLAALRGSGGSAEATLVLEEEIGLVPVRVRMPHRAVPFAQLSAARLPEGGSGAPVAAELSRVLRIPEAAIAASAPGPSVFSCGVPFLFVELRDRRALSGVNVDAGQWSNMPSGGDVEGIFAFTADTERPGSAFRARMFAPGLSVPEDPATGSAVAAFAGYLSARDRLANGAHQWRVEQGFEMGRPSILELECDVTDGRIIAVRVGGNAVIVSRGELLVS